jgi:hypothetical protein
MDLLDEERNGCKRIIQIDMHVLPWMSSSKYCLVLLASRLAWRPILAELEITWAGALL